MEKNIMILDLKQESMGYYAHLRNIVNYVHSYVQ